MCVCIWLIVIKHAPMKTERSLNDSCCFILFSLLFSSFLSAIVGLVAFWIAMHTQGLWILERPLREEVSRTAKQTKLLRLFFEVSVWNTIKEGVDIVPECNNQQGEKYIWMWGIYWTNKKTKGMFWFLVDCHPSETNAYPQFLLLSFAFASDFCDRQQMFGVLGGQQSMVGARSWCVGSTKWKEKEW